MFTRRSCISILYGNDTGRSWEPMRICMRAIMTVDDVQHRNTYVHAEDESCKLKLYITGIPERLDFFFFFIKHDAPKNAYRVLSL